jgi:probable DNA metabolism protein
MMTPVVYDGSFDGFLSAVFFVFDHKLKDVNICREGLAPQSLFSQSLSIEANPLHVKRVWNGLGNKISPAARKQLYDCFLSEIKSIENVLLRYIQYVFASKQNIESDFSNPDVLLLKQVAGKVYRERHRMEAFVRFQQMKDGLFFAMVQPDFNVLPLLVKHFRDRYADQRWIIYDTRRKYGIYYDMEEVEEVQFAFSEIVENGAHISAVYDENENLYQVAWKQYFSSVNIAPRKNMKLHLQHMPRRYWKYLPEKHGK